MIAVLLSTTSRLPVIIKFVEHATASIRAKRHLFAIGR